VAASTPLDTPDQPQPVRSIADRLHHETRLPY